MSDGLVRTIGLFFDEKNIPYFYKSFVSIIFVTHIKGKSFHIVKDRHFSFSTI